MTPDLFPTHQLVSVCCEHPAELSIPDLPAYVELHALQTAQRVCEEHRGGHRTCPQVKLRFLAGEHYE